MQLVTASVVIDKSDQGEGLAYVDAHEDTPVAVLRECLADMHAAGYAPLGESEWVYEPDLDLPDEWSRVYFRPMAKLVA